MINLTKCIKYVEVYYDGECGLCCTFHEWVNRQERANEIRFMPHQGEEAKRLFPELENIDPAREMVVRTSEGEVYRGAEGWIWCLWSCAKYRDLAEKFSSPALLPYVVKLCHLLAANRMLLSKLFFRKKTEQLKAELHAMPEPKCDGDNCKY